MKLIKDVSYKDRTGNVVVLAAGQDVKVKPIWRQVSPLYIKEYHQSECFVVDGEYEVVVNFNVFEEE